jgi:hypothetical protein
MGEAVAAARFVQDVGVAALGAHRRSPPSGVSTVSFRGSITRPARAPLNTAPRPHGIAGA